MDVGSDVIGRVMGLRIRNGAESLGGQTWPECLHMTMVAWMLKFVFVRNSKC
jgi:hypothetical protein